MSNNPFAEIQKKADGLEQAKDTLGGGFTLDSGVYTGTVKAAYAGQSSGGARSMTFVVAVDNKGRSQEYRETVYITTKNGDPFYEKNGKKSPLPGYTTANDIALLTTGQDLFNQNFDERVIKVYDFDQKAEIPTKVQMAIDIVGKQITLGILRQTVDKNVKDSNGNYVPSGETRDENVIDKVFHTDSGRTVSEVVRQLEQGEFLGEWEKKNKDQTRNRATGAAGKAGMPGQASAGAAPSSGSKPANLFG